MITHPTQKEIAAQKRYPKVEEIYETVGLGTIQPPVKSEAQWSLRKTHKTHFDHGSRCTSSPLSNTPGLYDGSAEARAILETAYDMAEGTSALMVIRHALNYLKGMDIPNIGIFTADLMGEETTEDYPEWSVQTQNPLESTMVETDEPKDC
jgi:hypothetical protein